MPDEKDVILELEFEGRRESFRIHKRPSCGNHSHLQLTGMVFKSSPRQFETRCACGCGYDGIATMIREETEIDRRFH